MLRIDRENRLYPLMTTGLGTLLFLIVGIIFTRMDTDDFNLIIGAAATIPLLSCLFLLLLGYLKGWKIVKFLLIGEAMFCLSALAGTIIIIVLAYGLWSLGELAMPVSYIILMVPIGALFGYYVTRFIYGSEKGEKRYTFPFVYSCVALVCGILLYFTSIDLDHSAGKLMMVIITSFGTSIGLATGIYEYQKSGGKKTKLIAATAILLAFCLIAGTFMVNRARLTPLADPDLVIDFKDPVFEQAVRDYYNLGNGDVLWKDLGYRRILGWWDQDIGGYTNSLEDLKWFTNLEHLALGGYSYYCGHTGDLSHIGQLKNLRSLRLTTTAVSGDIKELGGLNKLRSISIETAPISGDLSSLRALENLEELNVYGTLMSGVLRMPNGDLRITYSTYKEIDYEKRLKFRDSFIIGNDEVVGKFRESFQYSGWINQFNDEEDQLIDTPYIFYFHIKGEEYPEYFMDYFPDLNDEDVSGTVYKYLEDEQVRILIIGDSSQDLLDIMDSLTDNFLNVVENEKEHVAFTATASDEEGPDLIEIADPNQVINFKDQIFESAVREYLDIDSDIITWTDLGYVEKLNFDAIEIDGQIVSLDDLKWFVNLWELSFSQGHQVSGNLSSLDSLERLRILSMDGTDVTGDLNSLSNLMELEDINLDGTRIRGDLESLTNLQKLIILYLDDTRITGDICCLNTLKNLREVTLNSTDVYGDLKFFHRDWELEEFGIEDTNVNGVK